MVGGSRNNAGERPTAWKAPILQELQSTVTALRIVVILLAPIALSTNGASATQQAPRDAVDVLRAAISRISSYDVRVTVTTRNVLIHEVVGTLAK